MKIKTFKEPVYKTKVIALIATREELHKWLKKEKLSLRDFSNDAAIHFTIEEEDKRLTHHVWLEDRKDFYTLLHECIHLVSRRFQELGVDCDLTKGDEHFTYYVEYWFRNLWKFFGKL